jgi:hypothetical protein
VSWAASVLRLRGYGLQRLRASSRTHASLLDCRSTLNKQAGEFDEGTLTMTRRQAAAAARNAQRSIAKRFPDRMPVQFDEATGPVLIAG